MTSFLAAEGGYQSFHLHGGEWFWLVFSALTALLAIGVGIGLMKNVLAEDEGTPKMKEIALAIEEGALAYLKRQFKTIGVILVPLVVLVFFTATKVVRPDSSIALSFVQSGIFRTLAFLLGCTMSGLTGFIGMSLAVKGNVRTAAAAKRGSLPAALKVAFRTGGVAGMFTVGLGLIGATTIIMIFQNTSSAILIGFGFGGSLLALFLRVGGGIFTKAADVGADLVGKVEAGIPEDDPRNAATIADNVGDNVGDCAGMAADLFESYEVTLVASIILGVAAFHSIGANPALGLIFPVIARALGVLSSIVGVFAVKATDKDRSAMAPINRGFLVAGILTVITTFLVAIFYVGNNHGNEGWKVFGAVTAGLVLAQLLSRLTEYFTSTETRPVRDIAEATRTGPATVVLSGIASGLESSVYAILLIAITIGVAIAFSGGNIEFAFYLVALVGMGMLATTGVVVSEDTFGPVSDNAAGIAEMSGEFEGEAERIMVSLDAVGNTTKAVTKGFAIGSAVIASVALFSSFVETIGEQVPFFRNLNLSGSALFQHVQINVADPKTFIGLMIGGSIAFMFSSLAIRAVGRTAGTVVQEVRRQFREHPGIMDYTEKPEYGRVIDICTTSALRELVTPALLAVLTPVVVGFGLGYLALGAFLAAVIVVGQLMANFLSNSGGAWDNAKKYIEDGHEGGKGSDAHKAAVIGDTVGDPFKDTAGPALNPLIKVMNLVSLLILPAVVSLGRGQMRTQSSGAGLIIAGVGLVVLIVAIGYSKRKMSAMDAEPPSTTAPGVTAPIGPTVSSAVSSAVAAPAGPAAVGASGARETVVGTWVDAPAAPAAPVPAAPAAPRSWAGATDAPAAPFASGYAPATEAGPGWTPPGAPSPAPAPAPARAPAPAPVPAPAPAPWLEAPSVSETPAAGVAPGAGVGGASWLPPEGAAPGAGSGASWLPPESAVAGLSGAPAMPQAPAVDPMPFPVPSGGDAGPSVPAPAALGEPVVPGVPGAAAIPGASLAPDAPTAVNPIAPPIAPPMAPTPPAPSVGAAPSAGGPPTFITPTDQAHVDTNQPFRWSAVPGATEYCVTVGTAKGGDDLVNSGPLTPNQTSLQVGSLPAGRQLWARVYSSVGGHWSHSDVSFSAAPNQAELQWPTNGQSHVTTDRPFTWSRVPWATNYWLTIGTVPGGSDLLNTGPLPPALSSFGNIPPLPAGVTLYARLLTNDGSNWTFVDAMFTAA